MRSTISCVVCVLLTWCLSASAGAQSAKESNTRGFRLYKQKKYPEAMEMFQEAVELNPRYALAHYNLACVLCILREQGKVCDYDAYRGRIIEHLQEAVRLDPGRKKRMIEDKDLDSVRDTFGYQILAGLSPKKPADLKTILSVVSWYGPAPGAYGPVSGLDLHADGKLGMWVQDISGDVYKHIDYKGTWKLEGTAIRIHLDKPWDGKNDFSGTLNMEGLFKVPGLPGPFTDDPDECSA